MGEAVMDGAAAPSGEAMIRTEMRDGGVLLAVIDMPGRAMNVFSWALMDALERVVTRIRDDDLVRGAVVTSGKPSFLAGADLEMVQGFAELARTAPRAVLHARAGRLGRLLGAIEALDKPVVAAINGLALGGGLELTLACGYRVAADDPGVLLGVPEIKLGLLPGAGGTQRTPRLAGLAEGMKLLLGGQPVKPARALELGLIDEIVPADRLVDHACAIVAAPGGRVLRPVPAERLDLAGFDSEAADPAGRLVASAGYDLEATRRYPAYRAIARAVLEGAALSIPEGCEIEMSRFLDLMYEPTAGNMIRTLFIDRQKAEKQRADIAVDPSLRVEVRAVGDMAALVAGSLGKAGLLAGEGEPARLAIVGPDDPAAGSDIRLLSGGDDRLDGAGAGLHVSRSQHGVAAELVLNASGGAQAAALAILAAMRATPLIRYGSESILATLASAGQRAREAGLPEADILRAQANAAVAAAHREGGVDPAMADVAAVVSGWFPAFAGGPFKYLIAAEPGPSAPRNETMHPAAMATRSISV